MNATDLSKQDSTDMVTCGKFQSCFESPSIATMNNCLNAGTHGPVHNTMGGEWNNPEEEFTFRLGAVCRWVLM